MKLSDAILLGSTLGPQLYSWMYDLTNEGTCALGAAALATIQNFQKLGCVALSGAIADRWPWLREPAECPECGSSMLIGEARVDFNVSMVIWHLNDRHRWTRERIALEFVRPLEAIYDNQQASVDDAGTSAALSITNRPAPSGEDSGQLEITPADVAALMEVCE